MKKILGIALLAGGIVMLVFGFNAKDSVKSKLQETFTGTPSSNARWLIGLGAACSAAGVGLILLKGKN